MFSKKNILYIGDDNPNSTSYHRASALRRLSYNVRIVNPKDACDHQLSNYILGKLHYISGYHFLQSKVNTWLRNIIVDNIKYDLVWVNGGEMIGPYSIGILKNLDCPIILYNNDDPTGGRDGNRFNTLIRAIPYYDLCVVVRDANIAEFKQKGAINIIRVNMSYDEIFHAPYNRDKDIPENFLSEVAFIGTWMPKENRDGFIIELLNHNIPISIWGDSWHKSPYYNVLKPYIRGKSIYGRDYVAAIQGAKVCIGMLSKGNRDLYTTRSLEIPYIGGLLCAERTTEHKLLFRENEEAVFWDNADECAELCKKLLTNDTIRNQIKRAGSKRVRENMVGNENICQEILNNVFC